MKRELCVMVDTQPLRPSKASIPDKSNEKARYMKTLANLTQTSIGRFPAGNPVSFERKDLRTLKENFLVSLKSDGVRYLLLLTTNNDDDAVAIMIDRSFKMYEVEIWGDPDFFTNGTLLDGELVWDYSREPCPRLSYLVFDAIVVKGEIQINSYSDRLQVVSNILFYFTSQTEDEIEDIICEERKICAMHNHLDLRLLPKKFVNIQNINELWQNRTHSQYRNDGLIFTNQNSLSVSKGTNKDSLKWKPEHTIDVKAEWIKNEWKITVGYSEQWTDISKTITLENGNKSNVIFHNNDLLKCISEKYSDHIILECSCNIQDGTINLFAIRERHDKTTPNSLNTVQKTITNVQENITSEELLTYLSAAH